LISAMSASGGFAEKFFCRKVEDQMMMEPLLWADLISPDADPHHEKGWHPTGVFGTLAAAAAMLYEQLVSLDGIPHVRSLLAG